MKRVVAAIDILAFIFFGTIFILSLFVILAATSLSRKKRFDGRPIKRFSFPVFDLISNKYPSMFEDTLLGGYISEDHYIYLDFAHTEDRFENILDKIYFHSIAAHPDERIYKAGFFRIRALMTEMKILMMASYIVQRRNIAFIKAHDPHLLGLNALVLARLFRLPCALHLNSDFDMKYIGTGRTSSSLFGSRALERAFENFVMSGYDIIMADREFYRKSACFPRKALSKYRAFGVRVDRTHYTPSSSRRDLKSAMGLGGRKVLLYVGRLHPVKYPEDAIRAFGLVKREIREAALVLVGSGILREFLEEIVKKEHLDDSVFFLGSKNYEELTDILYTADILIAPHGGVTLVESALASTPVVAYDFDWHSEFLEDAKMGFLVPFKDVKAMAGACIKLFKDAPMMERFGEYARRTAMVNNDRQASMKREKDVYEELLGRGGHV